MSEITNFINFISRGNLLDIAIGIIVGTAFSNIIKSFVEDIIGPFIDLVSNHNMSGGFYVIRKGKKYPYASSEDAKKDGALILSYGSFFETCFNFFVQALAIFIVIRLIDHAKKIPKKLRS